MIPDWVFYLGFVFILNLISIGLLDEDADRWTVLLFLFFGSFIVVFGIPIAGLLGLIMLVADGIVRVKEVARK